mgnify:CR=1
GQCIHENMSKKNRQQTAQRPKPLFSRHFIETVNDANCPLIEGNSHHMSWVFNSGKICLNSIQPPRVVSCLDATNIVQDEPERESGD